MRKRFIKLVSLLMAMILCAPNVLASAEETAVNIIQPVFKDIQKIGYEEDVLDKIPDELIEITALDIDSVIALDTVDSKNMSSFTTVNTDGTKTLYSFSQAIKYIDSDTNTVKFIDSNVQEVSVKNNEKLSENYESEAVVPASVVGSGSNYALQDTYASNYMSDDNSAQMEFYVENLSSYKSIAYIKFDVSEYKYINPALVHSVTFNATETAEQYNVEVALYDCNSIYDISTVSYSQLSTDTGTLQSTSTGTSTGNYSFTITSLFRQWLLYSLNEGVGKSWEHGFKLKTSVATSLEFVAKEMYTGSPYISINYSEDTSINDGVYYIKNKLSGKYLEVPNSAMYGTVQCTQNDCKESKNQQWYVKDIGDGTYTLRPMHNTSFALDVYSGATNGSAVDIWEDEDYNCIEDIKWKLVENLNGSYRIMSVASGKQYSVAVKNASLSNDAKCIQIPYNASQNDQWIFEPAIDAAEYYITNAYTNENLSITSDGEAVTEIADTTQDVQRWSIVRQDDGTYKLYNKTGNWLDEEDYLGYDIVNDEVKLNSDEGQNWNVIINEDGTYSFENCVAEGCLTDFSTKTEVTLSSYMGTSNQEWNIDIALKDIYIGGFWEISGPVTGANVNYSARLVTDTVAEACEKIGCKELVVFEKGDADDVRDMIRQSSVFVVHTHGNYFGIACNSNGGDEIPSISMLSIEETGYPDTIITQLPNDSFATTRLAFLGSCSTSSYEDGNTTNFATVLHEKGVQTVICFNCSVDTSVLLDFQRTFMTSLGNGNTLRVAIDDAEDYIYTVHDSEVMVPYCDALMEGLEIIGNDDMSATFNFD